MPATTTGTRDVFVEANGLRHHLIVRGAPGTPAVMMVHGLTQQAHVFDGIAAHLAARFHVYCLDVRGRGESEWGPPGQYTMDNYVADLEAVRVALGLPRFALVGTSMGGMIATQYTATHPEQVSRLVLNDIGPEIAPDGGQRIMNMLTSAPEGFTGLKAVVRYYKDENSPVLGKRTDDEIQEYARWHVRKSDTGVYTWKMDQEVRRQAPVAPSLAPWDAFKAVACPVLILRGEFSDILGADTARKMAEAVGQCTVVEVGGVGHAPSLTEPDAMKALDAFLVQ
jgi:esterase